MRSVMKKVNFCDYCRKHLLNSPTYMVIHEKFCTKNPDRACKRCGLKEGELAIMIAHIKSFAYTPTLADLKIEIENGCPTCLLSIIKIMKLDKYPYTTLGFDIKKEYDEWRKLNENR